MAKIKIKNLLRALVSGNAKGHLGQYAEDVLVRKHFKINYELGECLDIGAYHPFRFNNTAFFWIYGWKCINIDANPQSIKLFNTMRSNDININAAVISDSRLEKGVSEVDLYINEPDKIGLSPSATIIEAQGIGKKIKVKTTTIRRILNAYCTEKLMYVNIDIEGADKEVLFDFDFQNYKPRVFSIEEHEREIKKVSEGEVSNFMRSNGYIFHSRADITSIYVESDYFKSL